MPFSITEADLLPIPAVCPVLGIPMFWSERAGLGVNANTPTIDRIINSRGYVPGNVVIISYRANQLKSDATLDEMRKVVTFYEHISAGHLQGPEYSSSVVSDRPLLHGLSEVQSQAEKISSETQVSRDHHRSEGSGRGMQPLYLDRGGAI
jgi:hypothetical protein